MQARIGRREGIGERRKITKKENKNSNNNNNKKRHMNGGNKKTVFDRIVPFLLFPFWGLPKKE